MKEFYVRNVHDALGVGLDSIKWMLKNNTIEPLESRNGQVLEFPTPIATTYAKPCERVVFYPERDANPFFHLMESLWMLAGRNDVEFVTDYVKTMEQYSDDGVTFNGAYGYRWRHQFGRDQLPIIIRRLKEDPTDRRCVVSMWDGHHDLDLVSKDQPCNTHIYFKIRKNKLNMTVCNRSNDMIWGAYGANAVHFSVLQEYMAAMIGVEVGEYTQFSDNLHIYLNDVYERCKDIKKSQYQNPYESTFINHFPLVDNPASFDAELDAFMVNDWDEPYENTFFTHVAIPMAQAYKAHQRRDYDAAFDAIGKVGAGDWYTACVEWLQRRRTNFLNKTTAA